MTSRKKWWMAVGVLLIICLGLGYLYRVDMNQKKTTETTKKEELVMWSYYETDAQKKGLDYLVKEFNDSQEQYELTWEYVPMSDYIKKLTVAASPKYIPDLILLNSPDTYSLIRIDYLEDITDQLSQKVWEDEYYPEVFNSVRYGSRVYGLPFSCNNAAIIYNKDMLSDIGAEVPDDWDSFKEVARELTNFNKNGCYGFAMSAAGGEQGAFQFMPWILSTGADITHMDDERGKAAFSLIDDMISEGSIPYECLNLSQNDLTKMFLEGKIAMMENGSWTIPQLDESGINYGIFPIPENKSKGVILGGENLCIVRGKNKEGAMKVVNFCTQPWIMAEIGELTGNISPVIENAERFKACYPQYSVFVEQMAYGVSRKSIPNWKRVCQALCDSQYQMFGSEHTTQQVWKKYVNAITMK